MDKQRKKPISNSYIISALTDAGLVPESRYGNSRNRTAWNSKFKKYTMLVSYKIPVSIYNRIIGKKFNVKLKIGNTVRFRLNSTRSISRYNWSGKQDNGDIFEWGNLGIGSGKCYENADVVKEIKRIWKWQDKQNDVALGNMYILNRSAAHKKAQRYDNDPNIIAKNYKAQPWHMRHHVKAYPTDFFKKVKLDAAGILGDKKLINGVITEVFVHFMYPSWEQKREARYEVLFETGARGIFTGDKLDRVFDTDFDIDERFNQCLSKCNIRCCEHKKVHIHTKECDKGCAFGEGLCQPIYDYTKLRDLTVGKGTIIDEEK